VLSAPNFVIVWLAMPGVAALFASLVAYYRLRSLREKRLTAEAQAWAAEVSASSFARHQFEERLQILEKLAFDAQRSSSPHSKANESDAVALSSCSDLSSPHTTVGWDSGTAIPTHAD
jgi:hypothetical protein